MLPIFYIYNMNVKQIQLENVILDLFVIFCNLYLIDAIKVFQSSFLGWSIVLGTILHLPMITIAYYKYSLSDSKTLSDVKIIRGFLQAFLGLGLILGFFSFVWILMPIQAYEMKVGEEVSYLGLYFFILLLFTLIFGAIGGSMEENGFKADKIWKRLLIVIIPAVFIIYSESLILLSADTLGHDIITSIMATFWMTVTFLPVRFFLFASPPVSLIEFASMSVAYASFVVKLF